MRRIHSMVYDFIEIQNFWTGVFACWANANIKGSSDLRVKNRFFPPSLAATTHANTLNATPTNCAQIAHVHLVFILCSVVT